jgi:hypothetical protein
MKGMMVEWNSNYVTLCLQFCQKYLKKIDFFSLSESILCDLNWDQILIDCQILARSLNTILGGLVSW